MQVGLASLTGLAGCLDESTDGTDTTTSPTDADTDGDESAAAETTTAATNDLDLRSWVPAPDAFPTVEDDFELIAADVGTIRARKNDLYDDGYTTFRQTALGKATMLDLPEGSVEVVVQARAGGLTLARTTLAEETLTTAFTDAGLSTGGSVGDRTVYEGTVDGEALAGVAVSGTVVLSSSAQRGSDVIEAALAARDGTVSRYIEASDDLGTVVGSLPDSDFTVMTGGDLNSDSVVGAGTGFAYAWKIGSEETTLTVAIAYPEGETPSGSEVSNYLAGVRGFRDYGEFTAETTGRVVLASGTMSTGTFDLLSDGDPGERTTRPDRPPQINFSFEYYPDEAETVIRHEGGDTATAENLTVTLDGEQTAAQWAQNYEQVAAGDALTVDVSDAASGATIRVFWEADGRGYVLAQFDLP